MEAVDYETQAKVGDVPPLGKRSVSHRYHQYESDFQWLADRAVGQGELSQEDADQAVGQLVVWLYQNRSLAA